MQRGKELVVLETLLQLHNISQYYFQWTCLFDGMCRKKGHPKIFGARLWHFSCWDVSVSVDKKTGSEYQRQLSVSLSLCIDLSHPSGIASPPPRPDLRIVLELREWDKPEVSETTFCNFSELQTFGGRFRFKDMYDLQPFGMSNEESSFLTDSPLNPQPPSLSLQKKEAQWLNRTCALYHFGSRSGQKTTCPQVLLVSWLTATGNELHLPLLCAKIAWCSCL